LKAGGESYGFYSFIEQQFVNNGLRGMEAYYPGQEPLLDEILAFCKKNNLIASGGSDDHQKPNDKHILMDYRKCPVENIKEITEKI
jgi:hypothetical protein